MKFKKNRNMEIGEINLEALLMEATLYLRKSILLLQDFICIKKGAKLILKEADLK